MAPDVKKNNEEIAAKQAAQDLSGQSNVVSKADFDKTGDELDKLAAAAQKEAEAKAEEGAPAVDPLVVPKDENAPAVDPAKAEADKKAAEEKAIRDKADLEKAADLFKDSPGLPPNASPKSSEAFSTIKIKAAQEISAREAEIDKLKKANAELETKVKEAVPPEVVKELEEHRQWRAKMDVDSDPKFKEYDKKVSSAQEFIYAQLRKSEVVTDAVIAEIKKHGGPEMVKLDKIFAAAQDPTMQKIVESKLADIEMAKYEKEQAVKATKENIGQYLKERQEQIVKSSTSHNENTRRHLSEFTGKLPWLKEQAETGDDTAKASAKAHNEFIKSVQTNLTAALADDSPEMRAILLTGMAQLLHLQRAHEAAVKTMTALETQLKEEKSKNARYEKSSVSRLKESSAPATPGVQAKKASDDFHKPATQALDDIARQVMEERAAKGQ